MLAAISFVCFNSSHRHYKSQNGPLFHLTDTRQGNAQFGGGVGVKDVFYGLAIHWSTEIKGCQKNQGGKNLIFVLRVGSGYSKH